MRFPDIVTHLGKFKVGIAGAGGLGSNCAVALARSGIGTLVIADFDIIEKDNLTRQYYFTDQVGMAKTFALRENIKRINPDVQVIIHQKKLERSNIPGIFSGCNVIVEALDNSETKQMFIETIQLNMGNIPVVVGSGIAGFGKSEIIRCRKIDDTLYICGDEFSEISETLPPMAPRVGMVANMQANVVIELLMRINEETNNQGYEDRT